MRGASKERANWARPNRRREINYTRIYGAFRWWQVGGCFDIIFTVVVLRPHQSSLLDATMIHGDGSVLQKHTEGRVHMI
jgi:hypothetical protein